MIRWSCRHRAWGSIEQIILLVVQKCASLKSAGGRTCSPDSRLGFRLQHIGSHRLPVLAKHISIESVVRWVNHRERRISRVGAAIKRRVAYIDHRRTSSISVGNLRPNRGYRSGRSNTKESPSSNTGQIVAVGLNLSA